MSYRVSFRFAGRTPRIYLVGVGGTGSLVADGLCRLLLPLPEVELILIDPDRVEDHNLLRQAFYFGDVGKFKSQVVAERLSRQYKRGIGFSVHPFDQELSISRSDRITESITGGLIIGCVDTGAARKSIADSLAGSHYSGGWWLDSGNSYNSGQVLVGNIVDKELLRGGFHDRSSRVEKLPAPSLQVPALLVAAAKVGPERDCAEAVAANQQSAVINQAMATLILEFVRRILLGRLEWLGAYIDLDAGTLQTVPADPKTVARMLSMKEHDLMFDEKEERRYEHDRHRNQPHA